VSGTTKWSEIRDGKKRDAAWQAARAAAAAEAEGANRLQDFRVYMGLSQQEVADRMGVSQKRVSEIEHADNLEFATMQRYVAALDAKLQLGIEMDGQTWDLLIDGELLPEQRRLVEGAVGS
jgi:transcriptional regulator with XRE-family HTH domain